MKKLLLLALAVFAISCSHDDNGGGSGKMVRKMATTGSDDSDNITYTYTYDGQKRLKRLKASGGSNYELSMQYNDLDLITSVERTETDQAPETSIITYDGTNHLQNISTPGGTINFNYDANTNSYNYGSSTFEFDSGWDFTSYGDFDIQSDSNYKGAFHNVKGNFMILQFMGPSLLIFGGRRDVKNLSNNGQILISRTSLYDNDGFPTHSNLGGLGVGSATYTY